MHALTHFCVFLSHLPELKTFSWRDCETGISHPLVHSPGPTTACVGPDQSQEKTQPWSCTWVVGGPHSWASQDVRQQEAGTERRARPSVVGWGASMDDIATRLKACPFVNFISHNIFHLLEQPLSPLSGYYPLCLAPCKGRKSSSPPLWLSLRPEDPTRGIRPVLEACLQG